MPTKPENMTDAEWNALDEVARMRAAKQGEEITRLADEVIRQCEELAALVRETQTLINP